MTRLLAGTGSDITLKTYDSDGELADVVTDEAPAAVSILDSAGTEVATPTGVRDGEGSYSAPLPTSLTTLDSYEVVWTFSDDSAHRTAFELVGGFIFTIAALRARYAEVTEAKYSADRVREVRDEVEDTFTRCARISFTTRGYREAISGNDDATLLVSLRRLRSLVSASIDDEALTIDELADVVVGDAWLERRSGVWTQGVANVDVHYEHGVASPPGPVVGKALAYARHLLVRSAFDEENRAVVQSTEMGTFRLAVAGGRHFTGLPDVDAVLEQWGRRLGAVG